MKLLVCGSRTFTNWDLMDAQLGLIAIRNPITLVIQGDATGADTMGALWARNNSIPVAAYPANWKLHGKAAGPIRNKKMLEEGKPDIVAAFTDKPLTESRGTYNMVTLARAAGVIVQTYEG